MAPPHRRLLLVFVVLAYAFYPVSFVRPVRTGDCERRVQQTLRAVHIKEVTGGSDDWRGRDLSTGMQKPFGRSRRSEDTDDFENRRGGYSSSAREDPEWDSESEEMSWNSERQLNRRGDGRKSERPAGRADRYSDGDDRGWGGEFDDMSRPSSREQQSGYRGGGRRDNGRGFGSDGEQDRRNDRGRGDRRTSERPAGREERRSDGDDRGTGGGGDDMSSPSSSREQQRGYRGGGRSDNGRGFGNNDDDERIADRRDVGASREFRTWSDDAWRMDEGGMDPNSPQSWSQDDATMKVGKSQGFYNVWQTVWVRGFDFKTPEGVLREHFATAGEVVDFWFDPRGSALARFKTIEEARNAVTKLDGTTLEGNRRYIDVLLRSEMATQPVIEESSVFVDGFDYGTKTGGLMKHFRSVGKVLHADLLTKSSAIVQYESSDEAEAAFEVLDKSTVPGNERYLRVLPLMPAAITLWGFDYETQKEDIVKHCSQVGEVLYAFKDTRGSSIVQYGSLEVAKKAVRMLDKTYIIGQKRYVVAQLHNINRRVFVSNLPVNTNWQDLKDHMRAAGDILFCNIVPNPERRRGSKGDYGLIEYRTAEEAQEAISKLSRSRFDGNVIFVQPDRDLTQREKSSLMEEFTSEQHGEGEPAAQESSVMEDDPRIPSIASWAQETRR